MIINISKYYFEARVVQRLNETLVSRIIIGLISILPRLLLRVTTTAINKSMYSDDSQSMCSDFCLLV